MTTTIPFPHPGDTILHDYLEPLGMSAHALAIALAVPPMRLSLIVRGRRAITADTALRLARYFGTMPQFWLNLQAEYDLRQAEGRIGAEVERQVRPRARVVAQVAESAARGRAHRTGGTGNSR